MDCEFLGLRHVALSVRNVAASADFYCATLGMRVEWKPDADNIYLTSGDDNLALHRLDAEAAPPAAQSLHHLGFVVRGMEDVDVWAARIQACGITLAQPPRTHRDGARSFYFRDPDGILIQVLYHPPISNRT